MSQELLERIASLEKSIRRWRAWALTATVALGVLLFAGIGLSTVAAIRAAAAQQEALRARDQAEMHRAQAEAARRAEEEAREREQAAQQKQ
jgi:hypothetical protein